MHGGTRHQQKKVSMLNESCIARTHQHDLQQLDFTRAAKAVVVTVQAARQGKGQRQRLRTAFHVGVCTLPPLAPTWPSSQTRMSLLDGYVQQQGAVGEENAMTPTK